MKHPIVQASRERALNMISAGCLIDYPDALARHSASQSPSFCVVQLPRYGDSRVYKLGAHDARWVIPLHLRTYRPSGTVVTGWDLKLAWPDHAIAWDCEPEDCIPKEFQDGYDKELFKSRLMRVLDEDHLIRRGCPVDGLLCGRSLQPMEESSVGVIPAKLSVKDDLGDTIVLPIKLMVIPDVRPPARETRDRVFPNGLGGSFCPDAIPAAPDAIPEGPGPESGSQGDEAAT